MNRTLIIGATGQIGKQLTKMMLESGHSVKALVRDKSKLSDVSSDNLDIVEGDLTEDFSHAFKGCNKVVFVAGSGPDTGADKTLMIDLWGACKTVDYAIQNDIEQFVMVSSIGADAPSKGPEKMQPYLIAKHMADEHLARSPLHYFILRPGSLTDDDALGKYTGERPEDQDKAKITRADVAHAIKHILENQATKNKVKELFNGEHSIAEALE